jgi:hypothetical protein
MLWATGCLIQSDKERPRGGDFRTLCSRCKLRTVVTCHCEVGVYLPPSNSTVRPWICCDPSM